MEEKFNRKISCLSMRLEEKLNRKNPSLSMRFEEKLNRKSYQAGESYYQLLEEVGYGVSATVYRAKYLPANEVVAVKCLDLDRCNSNLDDIRREAQTMSLIDHPTVIRAHCSFVVDRCLWVVMPFMAGGSCLHIMKSAYPNGFEEPIIARILKEILKALDYLHCQGHIHRDVKAGNILIDATGVVKLGDFGVSACMFDKGNRQWSRNTFVGTPCWMAPEVLQPGKGYDFKADIWSFGITALELAHGHAPFSKYPPMKVLLMTIQNASPGLDYQRDKKFSKSFKEMTAMCLVKDPTKRPTAEKLLRHSFFKHTKSSEYVAYNLLHGLPPLWDRVKALQLKDAAQLALKKLPSTEEELRSQNEYKQGVSAWNFDIDDLKAQAALIQDDDRELEEKEEDALFRESMKDNNNCCHSFCSPQTSLSSNSEMVQSSGMAGPRTTDSSEAQSELKPALQKSATITDLSKLDKESRQSTWEEAYRNHLHKENAFNGPLLLPKRASTNSLLAPPRSSGGVRTNASVIQRKGRFSVTSTDIDFVESPPFRESASVDNSDSDENQTVIAQLPKDTINTGSVPVDVLIPHLQTLLQQTVYQQEHIVSLLSSLHKKDATMVAYQYAKCPSQFVNGDSDISVETTTEREQILHSKIVELQAKILSLTDESRAVKARNIQLQQQLIAIYHQEEEDKIQKEERVKDP